MAYKNICRDTLKAYKSCNKNYKKDLSNYRKSVNDNTITSTKYKIINLEYHKL